MKILKEPKTEKTTNKKQKKQKENEKNEKKNTKSLAKTHQESETTKNDGKIVTDICAEVSIPKN